MRGVILWSWQTRSKHYCTIALPKDIVIDLQKAPTKEYYDLYQKFMCFIENALRLVKKVPNAYSKKIKE